MGPVRALAGMAAHAMRRCRIAAPRAMAWSATSTAAYELISRRGADAHPALLSTSTASWSAIATSRCATRRRTSTPFGTLLHFQKDIDAAQPRVLVVAPLSGHFATLLRGTVKTLLPEHDVYITDWHNARDVPRAAGPFGFDDYIEHLITFLEVMGAGAHVDRGVPAVRRRCWSPSR